MTDPHENLDTIIADFVGGGSGCGTKIRPGDQAERMESPFARSVWPSRVRIRSTSSNLPSARQLRLFLRISNVGRGNLRLSPGQRP